MLDLVTTTQFRKDLKKLQEVSTDLNLLDFAQKHLHTQH